MNSYIASGKGFLKNVSFDRDNKEHIFEWTPTLRDAQGYNSKSARNLIDKHELDAFIWQPYAQEPVRNKWRVVRRSNHYDFFNGEDHEVLEWKAQKVTMESKSDARFIMAKGNDSRETLYDSLEEAEAVALEKNEAILEELREKMGLVQN